MAEVAPRAVIEINLNITELKKLVDGTYANYGWLLKWMLNMTICIPTAESWIGQSAAVRIISIPFNGA